MRKWHEMARLPEWLLNQINKMERSYSMTSNVFIRYADIFEQLFLPPPNEKKNCKFRYSFELHSFSHIISIFYLITGPQNVLMENSLRYVGACIFVLKIKTK